MHRPRVIGYSNKVEAERARDKLRRQNAGNSLRHRYNTKRWRHPEVCVRARILARDGWQCQQTGVLLIGKAPDDNSPVVDNTISHLGNLALFWDEANLQEVSKAWHDSEKQKQDHAAAQVGG